MASHPLPSSESFPEKEGEKESSPIEESMEEMLNKTECHFAWRPDQHGRIPPGSNNITRMEENKNSLKQDNDPFLLAISDLLLAYEHGRLDDPKKSLEILQRIQSEIAKMHGAKSEERETLQYLTSCNLAYVHLLMGKPDAAREILDRTQRFSESQGKIKAQIFYAKAAAFSEFSKELYPDALEFYREGLMMDPENYNLQLGMGIMLGRIRRNESSACITTDEENEEIKALRKAVQIKRCHRSLVFLAESLREHARALESAKAPKSDEDLITKLNEEALELYIEVSEDPSANAESLVRCGEGFMRLPEEMRDAQKAKECYLKAYKLSPKKSMVNHKLGVFYTKEDPTLAKKHLEAAIDISYGEGNFAAHMTYVNLMLDTEKTFDPADEWKKMLERYPELFCQIELHILQMQYISQQKPKIGFSHAENALETLLQMKKPRKIFGSSYNLSKKGVRVKTKHPPKKFAHEHLLDGLKSLKKGLPQKQDQIDTMIEKVTTWENAHLATPEIASHA
ncbi:unnamed protein product [Darwinula stevensoni]|uniref:Uncharacterized protein n=1 Tax=Darwinula stevensoni TaxID=69355 RepID=A0A7R9AAJ1_9CRUS|nr:unnamed protein product [Darwinula stevensoni]CAG0898301.1 unnamed protein product [Darwinula stevensoni]